MALFLDKSKTEENIKETKATLAKARKLTDKLNEKWAEDNIRTKAGVAFQYVMSHPEEYDRVAAMNPEFAQKYEIGEKGRPVKRK